MAKNQKQAAQEVQPWQLLKPVELSPDVSDKNEQQSILIAARQSPGFPVAGGQLAHAMDNRAMQVLFDFMQTGVNVRYQVDGLWEQQPSLPRDAGDAMLVSLKTLAELNPQDRRSTQSGKFKLKSGRDKWEAKIHSQGVPTGERVVIRLTPEKIPFETLADLGMRDKMIVNLKELLNANEGIVAISAPKSQGLTTSWTIAMEAADKFIRDYQSIEPGDRPEPEIINVNPNYWNATGGPTPSELLRSMILKEPDVFVMPEIPDGDVLKTVLDQVMNKEKHAITRLVANDAVEATQKLVHQFPKLAKEMSSTICGVLNQRLVRRLCDTCKQGFQPQPAQLQRLGIPPGRVSMLYRQFVPPPIEQQVDEKGRPNPIPPCPKCKGRGYLGRVAIFELLKPGEQLRKALLKTSDLAQLRSIAKAEGHKNLQAEAILTVARGLTSLEEVKRIFSSK